MSNPQSATTTTSRTTANVADYFCVVGVGDQLTWQHTQKQQDEEEQQRQQQQQLQQQGDAAEVSPATAVDVSTPIVDYEANDDQQAEERFYREIVEVSILVVTTTNNEASKQQNTSEASTDLPTAPSHTTEEESSSTTPSLTAARTSEDMMGPTAEENALPLPASPSHSDATTTATNNTTLPHHHPNTTSILHVPRNNDGWTVLQNTLPCASAIYGPTVGMEVATHPDDSSECDNVANDQQLSNNTTNNPFLWNKFTVWNANLVGLRTAVQARQQVALLEQQQQQQNKSQPPAAVHRLRRKMESTWKQVVRHHHHHHTPHNSRQLLHHHHNNHEEYYLAYKQRRDNKNDDNNTDNQLAIAEVKLYFVRLHSSTLVHQQLPNDDDDNSPSSSSKTSSLSGLAGQLLERYQSSSQTTTTTTKQQQQQQQPSSDNGSADETTLVPLSDYLSIPDAYDEWCIPEDYQWIRDPQEEEQPQPPPATDEPNTSASSQTVLFDRLQNDDDDAETSFGVEAIEETIHDYTGVVAVVDPVLRFPKLLDATARSYENGPQQQLLLFHYIPVLAIRRQRVGEEERYHEDPAIVDLSVTFMDHKGAPVLPHDAPSMDDVVMDEPEDDDGGTFRLLGKTNWTLGHDNHKESSSKNNGGKQFGSPMIIARRNLPFGFADVAFATKVQGRFPFRNYKSLPLPEEELPMFCYPTGCRLYRARFSDAPVAQYYGFVVKNERGDSIYVSCVSFMEPLTPQKEYQLSVMSEKRKHTSLPHRRYCERRQCCKAVDDSSFESSSSTEVDSNFLLTAFDAMTTFENKTICLVSRFPFWTAFRKFLLHMHILSGSSSDLPLERYISHLLLSVPLPKPGGPNVLVPLPALSEPMVLSMPPEKDFPLVDLPYQRVFACLDIRTIVTIVLSLLALERKLIVMSTRPSLVLDVCELLRSLLFPFELCAPYVPRLTEPFKSSLEFPGAIFVGIHDDGSPSGLAAMVKETYPEDSIVVDLDAGHIDCYGDRVEIISKAWDLIPRTARMVLVSELETLCRDAAIIDGQEPLDSQFDAAFDVALESAVEDVGVTKMEEEPFDDRGARDAFLRFFCAILGGYERFLVVPDADFLVSGNEWFDAKGFLAAAPEENTPYLSSLVGTQLFQSFIQRRTEASDVHCLLFDESLAEFHASAVPYGRLGGDVEVFSPSDKDEPRMLYSLLVDQSATSTHGPSAIALSRSLDTADGDVGVAKSFVSGIDPSEVQFAESALNPDGDLVTAPTRLQLPGRRKYTYCIDGNPCFPHAFQSDLFLPKEPESWLVEVSKSTSPLLARSEREVEEANLRRRMATSHRGFQAQRRCMWQLPKLMGSHFLGSWLLCIPSQVAQPYLSYEQQSVYLLRALGALRLLRSKQRIVPDEAAYRALMVACGRAKSDRRVELVKLFGLLRSDGIFPSAVTLGQYTKALAEGYSKRSSGLDKEEDLGGVEVMDSGSRVGRYSFVSPSHRGSGGLEGTLNSLDPSLSVLEDHGRRWRHRSSTANGAKGQGGGDPKRGSSRPWLPVVFSSSFAPPTSATSNRNEEMRLVSLWSRTQGCGSCCYIPLEEEMQAGWDVVGGENEVPGSVACPRCGNLIVPMLCYRELSLAKALKCEAPLASSCSLADFGELPPQISPLVDIADGGDDSVSYVAYLSPSSLRVSLEQYVEEYGEEVLEREKLKELDPGVFYNLWWYSARFSLPLPLPISLRDDNKFVHYSAFVAWDRMVAERGCWSAAKVLAPLFDSVTESFSASTFDSNGIEPLDDLQLLSRFNLQGFYSTVWDHTDLSKILVTLVEACDKRDFRHVVESVLECNRRRHREFEPDVEKSVTGSDINEGVEVATASDVGILSPSIELDVYRTILYLAKYQCTTAFHAFFPATLKACKGYHYWCAMGTPLPIFDRLVREGAQRLNSSKEHKAVVSFHTVSEVALGFRCVFGHLI